MEEEAASTVLRGGTPKIIQLIRQAQGLAANPEEESALRKLTPHVPGIVTFADHSKPLPWSTSYTTVLMFADVSGFTSLCECYSSMQNAGIDQLTKTLNDYLGTIVEGIVHEEGDVLKFAGDAILSVWRVNNPEELSWTVDRVIKCCLQIQDKCGQWETDIGVTLSVKMGVACGDMTVTFIGNNELRAYVELGKAVTDVNTAESMCKSGYVVLSSTAWRLSTQGLYEYEVMPDDKHVRIVTYRKLALPLDGSKSQDSAYIKEPNPWFVRRRRTSHGWGVTVTGITAASAFSNGPVNSKMPWGPITSRPSSASSTTSGRLRSASRETRDNVIQEVIEERDGGQDTPTYVVSPPNTPESTQQKPKVKFGLSKLKNVVKAVTAMRLDEALRLYIPLPVLKKLDDNQPLEYLSEMRQVTVVFMNMVLDEDKDTTQLLQEIFEIVYSQSKVMHGCLNKAFLFDKGCTFLVLFGLPGYKHERDCAHALYCSQKMKNVLNDVSGVRRISIGVTTGATFCGVVGHKNRHEYSVIGRKVNMAARLMMHYPDKVTCDDNTFQSSRLPATNFEILATKRMKGLRNVGVIREYVEDKENGAISELVSIQHFPFPVLGREQESELFKMEIQKLKQGLTETEMNHYILCGASGIGKTRMMDHFIIMAEKEDIRVISCALTIENSYTTNFLTRHIVRMLLSSAGYSHQVDKEPDIMYALRDESLIEYMYLLNGILQTKFQRSFLALTIKDVKEDIFYKVLMCVVKKCIEKHSAVILAIDDAQNMDSDSWMFLHKCLTVPRMLVVLSSRPAIIENPPCDAAHDFIEDNSVRVHDLGSLDVRHTAALACQLMDVVRIPKQLERMLKERSQGVPYWCEQLLVEMAEKEQILIVPDLGTTYEDTIAPATAQIRKLSIQSNDSVFEDEVEVRRTNSVFKISQNQGTTNSTAEMFQAWGLAMASKRKESKARAPDKVAVFSPTINPEEIPIPTQMKEFITARLDSMRASEQLIVKCATILGARIPRDMIESILPNIPRVKARRCFKRLMQIGIFECANTPTGRSGILAQQNVLDPTTCFCPKIDDDFDADLCNLMRFKNKLLQETAYDVLMESQRLELHAKAAQYLDKQSEKIKGHIPYYLLNRDPPLSLEEIEANFKGCLTILANFKDGTSPIPNTLGSNGDNGEESKYLIPKDTRLYGLDTEYSRSRRGRRKAVALDRRDADPLLKAVLKIDGTPERTEELAHRLMGYYQEICRHWMIAKKMSCVLNVLLEAVSAALIIKDTRQAQELLDTLESILHDGSLPQETVADVILQAKILRLRGKIEHQWGHRDTALKYIKQAARLLGMAQPDTKLQIWLTSVRYLLRLKVMRKSTNERRPATKLTLEQGLCLSDLYDIYKENGDERMVLVTALRQMIKITGRTCHLHQVVQAYAGTIRLFRIQGKHLKTELENELFSSCAARFKELSSEDLGVLARLYTDMTITLLNEGNIKRSILTGKGAFEICDRISDQEKGQEVAPLVAISLIHSCQNEEFSSFLQKFKDFISFSDLKSPRAWFYSFCMERMLNGDFPVQTFQSCLDFAALYLKTADAVSQEFLPRYFLAMTISVWFCRKGHWEKAQTWFDYWETYEPPLDRFLALYAFTRKIEVMLLSLCTCRRTKARAVWKDLAMTIQKDLGRLAEHAQTIRGIRPRYHHLRAYFNILRESPLLAKVHLRKAIDCAEDQDNTLESKWAQRHLFMWFSETKGDDSLWNSLTNKHITEWRLMSSASTEPQLFTWPIRPIF
ncbi:hypothetical protein FSP39_011947 [Pinctada imbricata]|uniref:Guanylate cyclase domain-containing protein n=1 Tax=Pinctada imbricata TaxID=66713 RepID=A0AA88XWF8_PINIB|nr:hypothetical protein FSP39_011947 [Pinctada imbricata]